MITVGGIGSGLDVESLVSQLVQAERQGADNRYARMAASTSTEISAFGALRGAMSSVESALSSFSDDGVVTRRKATTSSSEHFTASASASASAGVYDVKVKALATAHKLASGAYAGLDTAVGTGSLSVTVGDSSLELTLDGDNNSLAGIRDAINNADDNPGVRATTIKDDDGYHLVLTATVTGLDNQISVTRSGGDGGLDSLVYDPGTLTNLSQKQEALNAEIELEGFSYSSSSNTVEDAIEGVTINLQQVDTDSSYTLTVSVDDNAIVSALNNFVSAFNTGRNLVNSLSAYNAASGSAGVLQGDALTRGLQSRLRDLAFADYSASNTAYSALGEIGIAFDSSGALSVDATAFKSALSTNFDDVVGMLTGEGGIRANFETVLGGYLDSDGLFDSRADSLSSRQARIATQQEALDRRMEQVEARLRRQFTALDGLVAQLNTTSNFLTQQLAGLSGSNS